MRADLHIHTIASDGTWTPEEVVASVRAAGLGLFAVADHDTMGSIPAVADIVRHTPGAPAFLPAVEISTALNGTLIHILGYGVPADDLHLNELLTANRERLEWVNEETLRRMKTVGYPVDLAAYEQYQNDQTRGGWKGLNFLIDNGLCRDVVDFFTRIFVDPVRPPMPDFPHPSEAVRRIREVGGIPVLAHPGYSLRGGGSLEEALTPFLEFGVAGVECHSPYHDAETTACCRTFCARHGLLITGGSDCHGGFNDRQLGVPPIRVEDLQLGPLMERVIVHRGARRERGE